MKDSHSHWPEVVATVLSCHYEMRAGRALAFGVPAKRHFLITYNYWASGHLLQAACYSEKAMPQGTLFPIRYDPEAPHQNHRPIGRVPRRGRPVLLLGIAGSVLLSLAWLAVLHGCS